MLTKKTPESIKATLTVKCHGEENTLKLTYFNHDPEKLKSYVENKDNFKSPEGADEITKLNHQTADMVLFLVKSFDDGTETDFPLNKAGLLALESHFPNILYGIIRGYHQSRAAEVEKN